jgi:general secretion pathway protein J
MNNPLSVKATSGFTLLEVLIAMTIFAIMSVMAYSGLRILLDAKASTSVKSEQLAELQMTLYLLNEDLLQTVPRAVRDEFGSDEAAFRTAATGDILTFTRSVPEWSDTALSSQLQRVSYRVEQDEAKQTALYRILWTTLDRTQQSEFRRRKLINLEQLKLRYFDTEWTETWIEGQPPKALEMTLTVTGFGDVKRVFFIHD